MISMALQRDVPQYMAIPWLMTWVMARTVSAGEEGESGRRALGSGTRGRERRREGGWRCTDILQAVYVQTPNRGGSLTRKLKEKGTENDPQERERLRWEIASPHLVLFQSY